MLHVYLILFYGFVQDFLIIKINLEILNMYMKRKYILVNDLYENLLRKSFALE